MAKFGNTQAQCRQYTGSQNGGPPRVLREVHDDDGAREGADGVIKTPKHFDYQNSTQILRISQKCFSRLNTMVLPLEVSFFRVRLSTQKFP